MNAKKEDCAVFDLLEDILHTVRFTRHYAEVIRDMLADQESKEPRPGAGNLGSFIVLADLLANLEENADKLGYLLEEWKPKHPPKDTPKTGGLCGRPCVVNRPYGDAAGKFLGFCTLPYSDTHITPPPAAIIELEGGIITLCKLSALRFTESNV